MDFNFIGTIWSLLPPVVAIGLALKTKEVYSSLFIGIVLGAILYSMSMGTGLEGFLPHLLNDTTIMASAGAECKHVHHVSSQLPYALTVAAVSFLTFVVAGFTQQLGIIACAAISWVSGIAMLFSALWGLRRISR